VLRYAPENGPSNRKMATEKLEVNYKTQTVKHRPIYKLKP